MDAPRDDLTKDEVIRLAMRSFGWKELKCLSWYKLQNPNLGGNSPMELVQRGQTGKLVEFLERKAAEKERREEGEAPPKLRIRFRGKGSE